MFHHYTISRLVVHFYTLICCTALLGGCTRENLSDVDQAIKLVLLDEFELSRPPWTPREPLYCIAFLDTWRNPKPRVPKNYRAEWDVLCDSIKQGRVRDPEPWLIPSLRGEFLLNAPNLRPFSQCKDPSQLTQEQWDLTRLTVVEQVLQENSNLIIVTLQARSPCYTDGEWETTWGSTDDCVVARDKDGRWMFKTCVPMVQM